MLELIFKKGKGKPDTISCTRADGSVTWTKLQRGMAYHDLAHYAVESTLGYQRAFYGLLAEGYDIGDFEKPREQRSPALIPANLPQEAIITEYMVNLLQTEYLNSGENPQFLKMLKEILADKDLIFPTALTPDKLVEMRTCFHGLANRWLALPPGESLSLTFTTEES